MHLRYVDSLGHFEVVVPPDILPASVPIAGDARTVRWSSRNLIRRAAPGKEKTL